MGTTTLADPDPLSQTTRNVLSRFVVSVLDTTLDAASPLCACGLALIAPDPEVWKPDLSDGNQAATGGQRI